DKAGAGHHAWCLLPVMAAARAGQAMGDGVAYDAPSSGGPHAPLSMASLVVARATYVPWRGVACAGDPSARVPSLVIPSSLPRLVGQDDPGGAPRGAPPAGGLVRSGAGGHPVRGARGTRPCFSTHVPWWRSRATHRHTPWACASATSPPAITAPCIPWSAQR